MVLTFCSVYLGVSPPGLLFTWNQFTWESCHMTICPIGYVHYWFGPLCFPLTFGSVFLEICPTGCLSSLILSTLGSGHIKFSPNKIVSTIGSVNSGLCSLEVLSTWDSLQLGVCLLGFCLLASLATWHFAHVGLFPLLALSTLISA